MLGSLSLWRLRERPYVLLTFAPLFWAGNIVLGRGVIDTIPPISLAFWRWSGALILLLPFAWRHVRRDWPTAVQHWKILALLALLGISCFNTLLYVAVQTTTAINGALVQSAMPAVIIVLSLLLFREKIAAVQSLGVSMCVAGAAMIVVRGSWHTLIQLSPVQGDVWMMVAVVLYALYSVLLRKRPALHPLSFLTLTFGIGVLSLAPLYLWELSWVRPTATAGNIALSVMYLAVFPSVLAYLCWNRGIELIGANRGGLFINLIPVFASILAIFLLGESLHAFHVIGMGLIFGGMVLFNRCVAPLWRTSNDQRRPD